MMEGAQSKPEVFVTSKSAPSARPVHVLSKRLVAFVVFLGVLALVVVILQFCIKTNSKGKSSATCSGDCTVTLVESIPENVKFPKGTIRNPSIYNGWMYLLKIARKEIDIASFYWTLRRSDTHTSDPSTKQGEDVFNGLQAAAKRGRLGRSIYNLFNFRPPF